MIFKDKTHKTLMIAALLSVVASYPAQAAGGSHAQLEAQVENFLLQKASVPGATAKAKPLDRTIKLKACDDPQLFLPYGNRAWGRTTVGVKCNEPAWTLYIQAYVNVPGKYAIINAPISRGQVIGAADIRMEEGDLTNFPPGVISDPAQVIGRQSDVSLTAGSVLRHDMFKVQNIVNHGQKVKMVSNGPGFMISSEGTSQGAAGQGQSLKVKAANGQVITGIVLADGTVDIKY